MSFPLRVVSVLVACAALLTHPGCAPAAAGEKNPSQGTPEPRHQSQPQSPGQAAPAPAGPALTGPAPAASPRPSPITVRPGTAPNNDCWWHERQGDQLTAVWLSPRLTGEVPGGFRFLTLVHHAPRERRPVILSTHVARLQSSTPLQVGNRAVRFTLTPVPGKTWSEVVLLRDLTVERSR